MKSDMSGHVMIRTQYAKTCRMAPIQVKSHHDLRVAKSPMRTNPGNHSRARVNVPKTENNILGQYIWRTKWHYRTNCFGLETKFWPENLS